MQLDHLSPSIYHNLLIVIALIIGAWILTGFLSRHQQKNNSQANPWWNRGIWGIVGIVIISLIFNIGKTGHHDYQVQTNNYIKTRKTNVTKVNQLNHQIQTTQDQITFNTVKMNQTGQSDHQIKKLIQKNDQNQTKLNKYQTQLKAAQKQVKSISKQGVPQ